MTDAVTRLYASSFPSSYLDEDTPSNRIEPGDEVCLSCTILYRGTETDPDDLTLKVTSPGGVETVYVLNEDEDLVREDPGKFRLNFTVPGVAESVGDWSYQWDVTGSFSLSTAGTFKVSDVPDTNTISLVDDQNNPVAGAKISVFKNNVLVAFGITGPTGTFDIPLEDGDYKLEVQKPGWRFPKGTLHSINGSGTLTVIGMNLGSVVIPALNLCRLFGYIFTPTGTPVRERIVVAAVGEDIRAFADGQIGGGAMRGNVGITRDKMIIHSRIEDGYWEVELVRGALVEVMIPSMSVIKRFRVPEESAVNLADVRTIPVSTGRPVERN